MSSTIAYLVNQYPKVSHSFIRREIFGVEEYGISVKRFSIRSRSDELVDEADKAELSKTKIVLAAGGKEIGTKLLQTIVTRPIRFLQALRLTLKVGWRSERGLLLHLIYLAEACALLHWLAEAQVSQVHAHFGTNSTTVAMLCHALGGPAYSFTVHGPEEFDKAQAIALPEKISRAAFVVAISSFGRSQLYRWCTREHWSKLHIVHCGVDQSFLYQSFIPIPATPQLVCIGRLSEQKGHLLLIEAVRQLAAEGLSFKIVLVGDGELREQIEDLTRQYHLQDHLEITGWASSATVKRHVLNSRALVLPSFAEGLPVVIMEALALGRPVISTYVAGIPELVEPEVCGWLVPAGSVEKLVNAMRIALTAEPEELERMGKAGAARIVEQYDAEVEAHKLARLFDTSLQQALSSSPDRSPIASNCVEVLSD